MRLNDLMGKEVINIGNGARLGILNDCELSFDEKTGKIYSLILPNKGLFNFLGETQHEVIPWQSIKRIGEEVIIVDLNNAYHHQENTY